MITVELHERPEDSKTHHQTTATLTVADDGTYRLDDPDSRFPTSLHVLVVDEDRQLTQVRFEDDPETWARNLHTLMRSGYSFPVITHDDNPQPAPATWGSDG